MPSPSPSQSRSASPSASTSKARSRSPSSPRESVEAPTSGGGGGASSGGALISQEDAPRESVQPLASSSSSHPWQAQWSAAHNAYYFWNAVTGETTWENPLVQGASNTKASTTNASTATSTSDLDPELAFLDPTQYSSAAQTNVTGYQSRGTFNRLTGKFVPSTTPTTTTDEGSDHTNTRAKRQMGHYFDVDEWENSKKKKNKSHNAPTKKEIQMYKAQKAEKKKRGMGWLHS